MLAYKGYELCHEKKNKKVRFIERHGLLGGIGGALIAGAVALFIHISKSDDNPDSQTCIGDNCLQIGDNKGTVHIASPNKESKDN